MATSARIRTPLLRQLNLFRVHVLPYAAFLACVAGTLWMWHREVTSNTRPTKPAEFAVDSANDDQEEPSSVQVTAKSGVH